MNNDEIFECLAEYIKCFRAYRMGDASDEIAQEECANRKKARECIYRLNTDTDSSGYINMTDEEQKSLLHHAAFSGFRNLVKDLIKKKANVNLSDESGNTPLHIAAERCDFPIVLELLKAGADFTKLNSEGRTFVDVLLFSDNLFIKNASPYRIAQELKNDQNFLKSVKGDTGSQGERGPVGPKGDKGDRGPEGKQGPKGEQGIQGERGEQGLKGDKGDIGPAGKQGLKGDRGDTGPEGKQGPQGERGDQGPEGKQGPKGEKGEQGPVGPKGDKGDQGLKGEQGSQGEPGSESKPGKDGNMLSFKITKDKSYGEISSTKIVDGENYDVGTLSDIGYFFQGNELYIRNHLTDKNIRVPQEFYFLKAIHDSSGRLKFALCNSSGNLLYEYKKYDSEYVQLPKFVEVSHLSLEKGEVLNRCHQYDTWGPVLQLKKNPSGEVDVCEITQEERKIGKLIDEFVYYKGDKLHYKNHHNPAENECCYGEDLYVNIRNNMAIKEDGSDNNDSTVNLEQSFDISEPFWMIGQC